MLREFQEEINKLKAQLSALGGSDPTTLDKFKNTNGDTVQQIVYKNAPEEMLELERKLAFEKEEIKRKAKEERKVIESQKNVAEEEKKLLLEKIRAKEEDEEKTRNEQQELIMKLKSMENMVVKGTKAMEKAEKQEKILKSTYEQLAIQREKESKLKLELDEKENKQLMLEKQ